jgi:bifunctional DNA-binding transcriptional regulator/antitoxin component of YhaV-PrlF toxin-antitoxin module
MRTLSEQRAIRSKVSPGFQVAVPAELRKRFGVGVGDEVVWILEGDQVRADFKRRPSLESIVSLGASGLKGADAVESKKRAQRGED